MPDDPIRHHGPSSIAALQTDDVDFEDGPWTVHGIALGEDDITKGVSDRRVRWPREALEDAAEALVGKKLTDGRNHDDLEAGQPPTRAIVGEVTEAVYEPGVGIVYRGEVDDPEIARLIARNRVDVSPVVGFEAREAEDGEGLVAESIAGFRDLAVVAEGAAPSNDISPGSGPLAAAAAVGLSVTFAEEGTSANDDPTGASSSGRDGDPETDHDPVADPDTDIEPMTDDPDITDAQRELLAAADQVDDPTVVDAEEATLLEEAADAEEPCIVDKTERDALREENYEVREALAQQLVDDELAAKALAEKHDAQTLKDRLTDDGEVSLADALRQEPETGGAPTDSSEDEPDDGPTDDDLERIAEIETKLEAMGTVLPADRVVALREEAADLAGTDDYEAALEVR